MQRRVRRVLVTCAALLSPLSVGATTRTPAIDLPKLPADVARFELRDWSNCQEQEFLPWCEASTRRKVSSTYIRVSDDMGLIRWAEARARQTWVRPTEPEGKDRWQSFADEALAGRSWAGDCDDLVFTVLDLMARRGFPASRIYRVTLSTTTPGELHMVGVVRLSDGRLIVVGDATRGSFYDYPAGWPLVALNHASEGPFWIDAPEVGDQGAAGQ